MSGVEPPDQIDLLRLIWCPDDVVDGHVQPSAFNKNDLKGACRYLSVDRIDLIVPNVVRNIAAKQQEKADPDKQIFREVAYSTRLLTCSVRNCRDGDGNILFSVDPKPIQSSDPLEHNPAHCSIANISGKKGKKYILGLQTELAGMAFNTMCLEEALLEIEC